MTKFQAESNGAGHVTGICEVVVDGDSWAGHDVAGLADRAGGGVLAHFGANSGYVIAILACDDRKISDLNKDFRGKAQPTNVLSWPSEDRAAGVIPKAGTDADPVELGDIAIAYETCAREAADQGKAFEDHVTHLLVHAILHLLGYDHEEDIDAQLMEALEIAILKDMGIADPYD